MQALRNPVRGEEVRVLLYVAERQAISLIVHNNRNI